MEIQMQIGTKVWANGKKAGTVSKIIVDPESSKPAYLVVRRGRLLKRDIVVPVGLVQSIADERIHLSMNTDELDSFPSYEVTIDKGSIPSLVPLKSNPFTMHVQKADRGFFKSTQRNVPERDIALHEGMRVMDASGLDVGKLEGFAVEPEDRRISKIVLQHRDPPLTRRRIIPVALVDAVSDGNVHLNVEAKYLYGLALYRPAPDGANSGTPEERSKGDE